MPTAVVCDDDAILRSAVSELCEAAGLRVVAETDSGSDAVMLVDRFDVDVLILDLSLAEGSGERVLEHLREEELQPTVVVFTAYVADPHHLIALGVHEVIEKPDLERLEAVLTRLGTSLADEGHLHGSERRVATRDAEPVRSGWRSPSGVAPTQELSQSLLTVQPGDAVLVTRLLGLDSLETDVGPLLVRDCHLAVARLLHAELRVQDLLHEARDLEGFVAILRGGDARAAESVWNRLLAAFRRDGLPGELHAANARVDERGGQAAVLRCEDALGAAVIGGPTLVSL